MRVHVATGLLAGLLVIGIGVVLDAQGQRASPHEKVAKTIDGASISVRYGRPYMKGRKIFGGLVPFGKVWRTGADEATTLTSDATLVIGSLTVPPGTYTIFTIPGEKEWELIVNKQTGQWGTVYQEGQDLGRVAMKVSALDKPVEQLTIDLQDVPAAGGELRVDWESTRATVGFTVKK